MVVPNRRPWAATAVLSTVIASALADCTPPEPSEWTAFVATVQTQQNNPLSVAAVAAMQAQFCEDFDISPCEANADAEADELHLTKDFEIYVPNDDFELVLPWLMEHRDELFLGYPVDVKITPDVECADAVTAWIGQEPAMDITELPAASSSGGVSPAAAAELSARKKAFASDNTWAYTSYFDQVHAEPYHLDTDCSSYSSIDGYHLHAFFTSNDAEALAANTSFYEKLTEALGLPEDVCADSTVEDIQDRLCWLTGPEGSFSKWPESHVGGSFATDYISVFMLPGNLTNTLSYLLYYRNAFALGGSYSMDFIVHPESGCSYADHIAWPLHAGFPWLLNGYGNAVTAEWSDSAAPAIDHKAPSYLEEEADCTSMSDATWGLYVPYNPLDDDAVAVKDEFVAAAAQSSLLTLVADSSAAYADETSPFLAAVVEYTFAAEDLGEVTAMLVTLREEAEADVMMVPHTGCPLHDFVSSAMWAGTKWPLNLNALSSSFVPPLAPPKSYWRQWNAGSAAVARKLGARSAAATSPDFVLYTIVMPNNQFSLNAVEQFTSDFAVAFDVEREGCSDLDLVSPSNDALCMLGENLDAYKDESNPIGTGEHGIYIPAADLGSVLQWALLNRASSTNGFYDLDLWLVPLTGDDFGDYSSRPMTVGDAWKPNLATLS